MQDNELLDRMSGETGGQRPGGLDKILNPKEGGEFSRLRRKLSSLWENGSGTVPEDSLRRMKARNTALRLSKNLKPRTEDDPGGKQ